METATKSEAAKELRGWLGATKPYGACTQFAFASLPRSVVLVVNGQTLGMLSHLMVVPRESMKGAA